MVVLDPTGLTVEVLVNDSPLKEYDDIDNHDDEREDSVSPGTVTKFIEAVSGAEFKIRYCFSKSFIDGLGRKQGIILEAFVDGKGVASNVWEKWELQKKAERFMRGATSVVNGTNFMSNFYFLGIPLGMWYSALSIQLFDVNKSQTRTQDSMHTWRAQWTQSDLLRFDFGLSRTSDWMLGYHPH